MEEIKLGWKCPQCGKVYSPFVSECKHCNESYRYIVLNHTSQDVYSSSSADNFNLDD